MPHSERSVYERAESIRLPGSPLWNVFKSFGRDEIIALLINTIGTVIAGFFVSSVLWLALFGPFIEKIGFYPAHLFDVWEQYKKTPIGERLPRKAYIRKAFSHGSESLTWDLLVHDPFYVLFFFGLSLIYPLIPIWLVASVSFLAAVVVVAGVQVVWIELRYALFSRKLISCGFGVDTYLEARFYIRNGYTAEEIVVKLREMLGVREIERLEYFDSYFQNDLPRFAGRAPVVRLRRRTFGESSARWENQKKMVAIGFAQTAQVVYTRPKEEIGNTLDQFRFFPVEKDKFFLPLDVEVMPASPNEIEDARVRKLLHAREEYRRVSFKRIIMLDATDALYVAVDALPGNEEGCVIELKVRKERDVFLHAMRTVMLELPVTHTTHQKIDLGFFGQKNNTKK